MAEYPVPQFIERESRIAHFLTMKQFVYLVITGALCLGLFYILPFFPFIIIALIIGGGGLAIAFLKIEDEPILSVLLNSLGFLIGSKNYIWKKEKTPHSFKIIKEKEIKKTYPLPIKEKPSLKIAQESKLKKIRTQVELHKR